MTIIEYCQKSVACPVIFPFYMGHIFGLLIEVDHPFTDDFKKRLGITG